MKLASALGAILVGMGCAPACAQTPGSWTGFYAGIHAGASRSGSDVRYSDYPAGFFATSFNSGLIPTSQSLGSDGALGGFLAGYNFQSGPFVLGAEIDHSAGRLRGTTVQLAPCACGAVTTTATETVNWLATARGRIGVTPMAGVLLYGTAGLALGNVQHTFSSSDEGGFFTINGAQSGTRTGLVFGGGAETMLPGNLTARVEYLHYDLGSQTVVGPYVVLGTPTTKGLFGESRTSGEIVRAAVTYRFN
jgi:outer membrane immunogenic protein